MEFGKIKKFFADKNVGSIEIIGNQIFFRKKDVKYQGIRPDDIVRFNMRFDADNQPFAINVEKVENQREFTDWQDVERVRKTPSQLLQKSAEEALKELNYSRARIKFQECIAQSEWQGQKLDETLFLSYGEMEYRLRRPKQAREVYELGRRYCPSSSRLASKMAKTYIDEHAFEDAEKLLTKFVSVYPPDDNTRLQFVRVLLRLSERDPRFVSRVEKESKFLKTSSEKDEIRAQLEFMKDPSGRTLWSLLRNVEFTPTTCSVEFFDDVPLFGYTLVRPGQQMREKYGFNKQLFVYNCFEECSQTEAITRGISLFNDYKTGREEELHQRVFLIFLGGLEDIGGYLRTLREDPHSNPTIVPISRIDAERAIVKNDAKEYIGHLLDEWLSQIDRYRENYPVHGRDFFGREHDIAILNKNIELGKPTGIFGLRKVGKTSILYQLAYIRTKDLVAYVDAQAAPLRDCKFIFWEALNKWIDTQSNRVDKDSGRHKHLKLKLSRDNYPTVEQLPDFDEVLKLFDQDVRALLAAEPPTVKLVLLIDEVELITPSRGNPEGWVGALPMIRYLRGSAQNSSKRFVPIIAGANPKVCEDPHWGTEDNPVFQFFDENFIPLLPEGDCKELVVKIGELMSVGYEKTALDAIFSAVGGHPYFTRRLCSHIVTLFSERPLYVTCDMVELAQEEFLIKEEALFNEIVFRLSRDFPDELEILRWVARGDDIKELRQLIGTWNTSIKHLEGYQLLERSRSPASLRINIQLFKNWLKREG